MEEGTLGAERQKNKCGGWGYARVAAEPHEESASTPQHTSQTPFLNCSPQA